MYHRASKSMENPSEKSAYPRYIFLQIFLLVSSPISQASVLITFTSCLTHHKISNFTVIPTSEHDPTAYYELLNFSIQNLRFTDEGVPKPVAIILPESRDELVGSVVCSREASLEIRVRSGGHSYEGLSSIPSGGTPFVIIDMMRLNRVLVELESETAWVQGGATLGEVYYAIAEASGVHGFSAGISPTVGCSGQISGGGIGLLARKYGLAADNVVDALLVDADGRVLDRAAMGEDVFWAIRGGGGGVWGVMLAWRIKLVQVPPVVSSFIVSRRGEKHHHLADVLLNKWQVTAPYLDDALHLSVLIGAGFVKPKSQRNEVSMIFKGFYLGPRTEALFLLRQSFPELEIAEEECLQTSWIESVLYFSGIGTTASNSNSNSNSISDLKNRFSRDKSYFKVKSDYVTTPIPAEGLRSMFDILEKEPKGFVILDPYGGAMGRISPDSIAFPHREGNLFNIHYMVMWDIYEDNIKRNHYLGWIRDLYHAMTPFVSSTPRTAHINYIDLDLGVMDWDSADNNAVEDAKVWGEKYFLRNYDRLVRVKTLVDPYNIFRHQQSIPPMSSVLECNHDPNDETWDLFLENLRAKSSDDEVARFGGNLTIHGMERNH
ncbi:hypothetical protein Dimus_035143 [Dionaea muscipula]